MRSEKSEISISDSLKLLFLVNKIIWNKFATLLKSPGRLHILYGAAWKQAGKSVNSVG